jgi:hypothetical protein
MKVTQERIIDGIDNRGLRACSKCAEFRFIDEFHRNPSKKNGRDSRCKACVGQAKAAAYRKTKKEKRSQVLRRKKNQVIDIHAAEILETYISADEVVIEGMLNEMVEAILCKRTQ